MQDEISGRHSSTGYANLRTETVELRLFPGGITIEQLISLVNVRGNPDQVNRHDLMDVVRSLGI